MGNLMKVTAKSAAVSLCLAMGALATTSVHAQMYWRLEVGNSRPKDADFKDNDFYNAGNILIDAAASQPGRLDNVDGSLVVGVGLGYRFTTGLRGDVTFAHRDVYTLSDTTFEANYYASITSTTLMVNGYYDFASGGVRPYVGAGVGVARNVTERLVQDFRLGFANRFSGATKDNAAFALMIGVSVPYPGGMLDFGYRYIDLGKFGTAPIAALGITSGHTGRLTAHEFTIGARF
jgi:opacity protein-like surface antigen